LYVANDAENLYVRIDARGKPSSSIESGTLGRELYIYIDTDNNNGTGYKAYGGLTSTCMCLLMPGRINTRM
jgi:hypothetical protein